MPEQIKKICEIFFEKTTSLLQQSLKSCSVMLPKKDINRNRPIVVKNASIIFAEPTINQIKRTHKFRLKATYNK